MPDRYDWIVIGSGFGGSVSALRLAEKGYRVAVLEKGRRFAPEDFPTSNWDLRRWYWEPRLGLRGFFRMTFLKHVTVLHGVGVGGGSLTYANTLPRPPAAFFAAPDWAHLADWAGELAPHYATARRMLGAARVPERTPADDVLHALAAEDGRAEHVRPTDVAVFFGAPGERVPDPYFEGLGPERSGCTHCGACMTGCRVGAKNTLDRNYLHLAEGLGATVVAETEVRAVRPRPGGGYRIEARGPGGARALEADRVVFAGGVLGTVPLLLAMKADRHGLPRLSDRLGHAVRTNGEALLGVIAPDADDLSRGVAITSIYATDERSHLEPVRYGRGSGFFRMLTLPHAPGAGVGARLAGAARALVRRPRAWARALAVRDFARRSQVLLYMRAHDGTLRLRRTRGGGVTTEVADGADAPAAFFAEATDLARRWAAKLGGVPASLATETLRGVPSTAHVLGGCPMGATAAEGAIDADHRLFGYDGLYVVDGSAVSANPGVNPALTITALAERAMARVPAKAPAGSGARRA
jgi:cholesterol oxidase